MASRKNSVDAETQAMSMAYAALKGLEPEAFDRAHDWIKYRYASDQRNKARDQRIIQPRAVNQ